MRKISSELSVWLVSLALGGAALVAGSALAVSHSETSKDKTSATAADAGETKAPSRARRGLTAASRRL